MTNLILRVFCQKSENILGSSKKKKNRTGEGRITTEEMSGGRERAGCLVGLAWGNLFVKARVGFLGSKFSERRETVQMSQAPPSSRKFLERNFRWASKMKSHAGSNDS